MRLAGVLLPVASLNSGHGVGDFGKAAYEFVDIISQIGFKIWQILPLNPLGYGNSPYQPYSSFAGDEIYINLDMLYDQGLIKERAPKIEQSNKIDYPKVREFKGKYLKEAFKNFKKDSDYDEFIKFEFVYNYAVYLTLKKHNQMQCWNKWPKEQKNWIKDKKFDLTKYQEDIEYEIFVQYIFYKQWMKLKAYANEKGIQIMGDIPIYVGIDSLDVWQNQKAFLISNRGNPKFIAGVPPDYFCKDGQRWGNPIYDWDYIEENGFEFWLDRIDYSTKLYDIIRIDHFRGFDTYWIIKARNKTARKGRWGEAPGYKLFDKIQEKFKDFEIVAEDLGDLRQEVLDLRDYYNLKGMKVLQFTMDPEEKNNDFEDRKNMIVYTGTHDNQTIVGWYKSQDEKTKEKIDKFFKKHNYNTKDISKGFMEYTLNSIADYAILPVQDIVGMDDTGRINTPGTLGEHNWSFKFTTMQPLKDQKEYMQNLIKKTKRK